VERVLVRLRKLGQIAVCLLEVVADELVGIITTVEPACGELV
jgi:hypothetical protein